MRVEYARVVGHAQGEEISIVMLLHPGRRVGDGLPLVVRYIGHIGRQAFPDLLGRETAQAVELGIMHRADCSSPKRYWCGRNG